MGPVHELLHTLGFVHEHTRPDRDDFISVNMDNIEHFLENEWERDTPNMFGQTEDGVRWGSFAYTAMSMFPREWVEVMAENWLDNPEDGFLSEVPFVCIAKQY